MLKRIKVISFDLDDTFWDVKPVITHAEQALYRVLEREFPKITDAYSLEDCLRHKANMGKQTPVLQRDVTAIRKAALADLLAEFGYPSAAVEPLFEQFLRARNQVTFYEGVEEVLAWCAERFTVVALSNGNACVDKVGIGQWFSGRYRATTALAPKPAADLFSAVCEDFKIAPTELLHVGDHPNHDILGAQQFGARSVWFNSQNREWPQEQVRSDYEIDQLQDLVRLLQSVSDE